MNKKEELIGAIEKARKELNRSIEERAAYRVIYENSVEVDRLVSLYTEAGY